MSPELTDPARPRTGVVLAVAAAVILLLCSPVVVTVGVLIAGTMTVTSMAGALEEGMCSRAVGDTSSAGGPVRAPVIGAYAYTSPQGMRLHPIRGVMTPHNGMDLATIPAGGPVVAFSAGTVATVTMGDPGAGNYVVVDHGGGLSSRYLHLASVDVTTGDKLSAGAAIGKEGSTGASTGSHLHFEIRRNGTPIDPAAYLKSNGVTVPALGGTSTAPPAGVGEPKPSTGTPSQAAATSSGAGSAPAVGPWSSAQVEVAAQIIARGEQRGLDQWTITVAVMTAMAESSLTNLAHGDAVRNDTVGVFQEGPERGPLAKRMNPADAADIFWDYLTKVPSYRDLAPTIAAHRAQANADPWHYQDHWDDAVDVVAAVTGDGDLRAKYAGAGGNADCTDKGLVDAASGALPDPPGMSCKATTSPGENGLQPSALRGLRCTSSAFPQITTMYGVAERVGPSDHGAGKAVDFMIEDYRSTSGRALGWRIAEWTRKNADDLGIQYVIFDQKIWNTSRDGEGWRPMENRGSDTENHLDHVHVSYQ